MLAHAEVVDRAPDGDLGADPVIEGARKMAAPPLGVGEDAVALLGAQPLQALSEEAFVIHRNCAPSISGAATGVQSEFRNATRSAFCWSVNPMSKRWL